jgi:hypothetical protein
MGSCFAKASWTSGSRLVRLAVPRGWQESPTPGAGTQSVPAQARSGVRRCALGAYASRQHSNRPFSVLSRRREATVSRGRSSLIRRRRGVFRPGTWQAHRDAAAVMAGLVAAPRATPRVDPYLAGCPIRARHGAGFFPSIASQIRCFHATWNHYLSANAWPRAVMAKVDRTVVIHRPRAVADVDICADH